MKTTLNQIREHGPCVEGWTKLLQHLNKTKADDELLSLLTVLDSNGLDDALWCLRAVKGYNKEKRLYAVWCAKQVQHLMTDERSIKALDVAERYANGEASDEELEMARSAAYDVYYAANNESAAVYYVVYYATYYAHDVARAAYTAAYHTARNTEKAKQEAEFRRLLLSLE
jgi:hypothetical protein